MPHLFLGVGESEVRTTQTSTRQNMEGTSHRRQKRSKLKETKSKSDPVLDLSALLVVHSIRPKSHHRRALTLSFHNIIDRLSCCTIEPVLR